HDDRIRPENGEQELAPLLSLLRLFRAVEAHRLAAGVALVVRRVGLPVRGRGFRVWVGRRLPRLGRGSRGDVRRRGRPVCRRRDGYGGGRRGRRVFVGGHRGRRDRWRRERVGRRVAGEARAVGGGRRPWRVVRGDFNFRGRGRSA